MVRRMTAWPSTGEPAFLKCRDLDDQLPALQIYRGNNIAVKSCTCHSGHGISIGSVASGDVTSLLDDEVV